MANKLIFLDIDGTLTEPGRNVPPASALEAVRKAQAAGNQVFLCTGRNRGMLTPLLQYGFDGFVGSSGGYVMCNGQVIFDCPMSDVQRDRIMNVLAANGVFRTVECCDHSYTEDSFRTFLEAKAARTGNSELLRWREQLEHDLGILPLSQWQGQPVYKFVFACERREQMDEPIRLLSGEFNVVVQDQRFGEEVNGEIVSRAYDKGTGVRRVCEALDVPLADTVGFGDSMNDLEMIQTVGLSFCMANGSPTLKKLASVVCPAVNEDGLYRTFEQYGLF